MTERPMLFSAPMVRGLLNDTKTLTRREIKPQPYDESADGACWLDIDARHQWAWHCGEDQDILPNERPFFCPYGQPGDRLWVRETFIDLRGTGVEHRPTPSSPLQRYAYAADHQAGSAGDEARKEYGLKWKPSIHMPRTASRITLEITGVRVERLQEISEADAIAEGIERSYDQWRDYRTDQAVNYPSAATPIESYRTLWESINGPSFWDANPWVWVVEFKRLDQQAKFGGTAS